MVILHVHLDMAVWRYAKDVARAQVICEWRSIVALLLW